ncbi:MAG: hypothetical protein ACK5O2_09030 [Microthrixaceae bacterium]
MIRMRTLVLATASVLSVALVSMACATSSDTGAVSGEVPEFGARLETSTTLVEGSGTRRAPGRSTDAASTGDATGPLSDLTEEQLSELTGLSPEQLSELGITPASVGALAGVIDQLGGSSDIDPSMVQALLTGGGSLLTSTGQLTGEAADLLAAMNIDPSTFAAIAGAAATVPPEVTEQLGKILAVIDPNGLGRFNGNASMLSVIAIVVGAALGADPVALGELAAEGGIDPRFTDIVTFFTGLVSSLEPELIERINRITDVLGPYTIQALGGALALIEDPEVAQVIADAFANPAVVATAFGALFTFIPGLPELLAPNAFSDPAAIYGVVAAIAAVALLNADAPGFRDFLRALGIVLPPEFN